MFTVGEPVVGTVDYQRRWGSHQYHFLTQTTIDHRFLPLATRPYTSRPEVRSAPPNCLFAQLVLPRLVVSTTVESFIVTYTVARSAIARGWIYRVARLALQEVLNASDTHEI